MYALLALLLIPVAPAGKADPPKKDADKLQGVWRVTTIESRGLQIPANQLGAADRYTLVIVGTDYAFFAQGGTIKFDPAKKEVDFTVTDGRYKGATVLGIYDLTGDTLKVAMSSPLRNDPRPTELKPGARAGHALYTFERD